MNISGYLNSAKKLAADNSPAILTAIGVMGTVTTAVLTGKAAIEADRLIATEHEYRIGQREIVREPFGRKEKLKLVWTEFIPPVAVGSLTIASIVCANQIGTRRAAAVAAAYSISEKLHREYKDKVIETLGEKKERDLRDELAQDRVDRNPPAQQVVIVGNGDVLCQDQFSGRYFMSTMETLKGAQNKVNYRVLHDGYQSLSDFYEEIGLPATSESEEVGWTRDKQLELLFSTTLTPDKRPCITFDFEISPVRQYWKHGYN